MKKTKNQYIEAAYELFNTSLEGLDAVTARKIAKLNRMSTMVIYYYFDSIGGLKRAVLNRAYNEFGRILLNDISKSKKLSDSIESSLNQVPGLMNEIVKNNNAVIRQCLNLIIFYSGQKIKKTDLYLSALKTKMIRQNPTINEKYFSSIDKLEKFLTQLRSQNLFCNQDKQIS